ncbi:hypothetical protein Tsubulata_025555 [Turnera subulata]|uniref:Uncharacterized protein n=1 Tax=Turnera subulata TaxID=218843 RepID=A0A9Q0GE64_9ROSI|nr:hypothetical protein Tsubulata_025555 [Turnera subulata]
MNQDCSKMLASDRVNVCVEVDYSKPLLDHLDVEIEGCTHSIAVSYSWKPQFRDVCNQWGHHSMACSLKKNSVQWVPKSAAVISDDTAKSTSTIPCQSQVHILSAVLKEPLVISDPVISAGSKEPLVISDPVDSTAISLASVSVNSCSAPATDLESSLLISNVSKSADCTDLISAQIDYVADLSTIRASSFSNQPLVVLVYIILSNSLDTFPYNKKRSFNFKAARSESIRRTLAVISDMPFGIEPSPSFRGFSSSTRDCLLFDDDHNS